MNDERSSQETRGPPRPCVPLARRRIGDDEAHKEDDKELAAAHASSAVVEGKDFARVVRLSLDR